jgi:hypothetical protein
MTVELVYERQVGAAHEIILASDRRLSGGESWDECQKVFPLRRGDCALGFAGAFYRFYPVFCQLVTYCNLHKKIYSRAIPLHKLAANLEDITQALIDKVHDLPSGCRYTQGNFEFLLCGWDFETGKPFGRKFSYDDTTGKMSRQRIRYPLHGSHLVHPVFLIGDCLPEFRRTYNGIATREQQVDLQPLTVTQDIIDQNKIRTIGGVVQGVKLYRHLNCLPIQIERGENRYVLGRQLFEWENAEYEVASIVLPPLAI